MTNNNTVVTNNILVVWNGDTVYVVLDEGELVKLAGLAGSLFVREASKLSPAPSYPVNSRGRESAELQWLPGCGGFYLGADKAEQVCQLLEFVDYANFA